MSTPVLHLLAGCNGAGKSTLARVLVGRTGLEFVNADLMAEALWPGDRAEQQRQARQVSDLAAERRSFLLRRGASFVTETVFSHPSKIDLLREAQARGHLVTLHVVMVPEDLAVARVADRVQAGGHRVPEEKIRGRYQRLWPLIGEALTLVDTGVVYDNASLDHPLRRVAAFRHGQPEGAPQWPRWTPGALTALSLGPEG